MIFKILVISLLLVIAFILVNINGHLSEIESELHAFNFREQHKHLNPENEEGKNTHGKV